MEGAYRIRKMGRRRLWMAPNDSTPFVIQLESQDFIMIIDKSISNRASNSQGIKRVRKPRLTTENLDNQLRWAVLAECRQLDTHKLFLCNENSRNLNFKCTKRFFS